MTSYIHNLPDEKGWGLEFNYDNWSAGTEVTLAQVRWNSDYRDTVWFENDAALNNHINEVPHIFFNNAAYASQGKPIKLDVPFNVAQKYNYLKATNPAQPIPGDQAKSFYYFIVDVVRLAPNTTAIYVQLDIWQTFIRSTVIGQSYFEQGHHALAAGNNFTAYGRDHLTVSEGLDIGGEYQVSSVYREQIAHTINTPGSDTYGYDIMIVTTISLEGEHGTVDKPVFKSAKGSNFQNMPNGAEIYVFRDPVGFRAFLTAYADKPWITQSIISIMAIPPIERYGVNHQTITLSGGIQVQRLLGNRLNKKKVQLRNNWREDERAKLPVKYRKLSKLLTYPYMVCELTTHSGNPIVIKPEAWNDGDANIIEVAHLAPPAQRIMFYPYHYNQNSASNDTVSAQGIENDKGEFLDMATGISNFPTFSLVNNSYMSYLASNSNSIAFQHSSADWGNSKAVAGNDLAYNQATMGINAATDQSNISIDAANAQNNLSNSFAAGNAAISAGSQLAGGAMLGPGGLAVGAGQAAGSALGAAMSVAQSNASTAISTGAVRAGADRSGRLSGDIRDTNKGYADFASNGDYSQAIAGINARTNDAKLTQPTTSGQMGGDAFNLGAYGWGYDLKIKRLTGAALTAVGDYMLRYGYRCNVFMTPPANFKAMSVFTFWKMKEVYIVSAECPEPIKQAIRGILEKGVTVWHNPYAIGVTPLENNIPMNGITL